MNADVIVEENVELVSMELAKKQLRLDADDNEEDMLVDIAIASAITQAENYTARKLRKGLCKIQLYSTESIVVERLSLNDKILKVEILEENVDSFALPVSSFSQTKRGPEHYEVSFKEVELLPGQSLNVEIEFGFDADSLPKDITSAMLLLIGDAYERREDRGQSNDTAVKNLLRPYRKWQ